MILLFYYILFYHIYYLIFYYIKYYFVYTIIFDVLFYLYFYILYILCYKYCFIYTTGAGRTVQRKYITVPVPAGVEDGQTVRMPVGKKEIFITFRVRNFQY